MGYDVQRSTTGELTGAFGEIDYFGGRTAGPVAKDIFEAGGFSWNQSFLAANESNWAALPADGFLGLAFNSISVGNATTVVETLLPKLDLPRFGIFYDPRGNGTVGTDAHLIIGNSKENDHDVGDLVTVPIIPRDEGDPYEVWRADFHSLSTSMGSDTQAAESTIPFNPSHVVFDTGGGHITFPEDKIDAVYESMGLNWTQLLNGERVLQCNEFNSSWSVSFTFGKEDALKTVTLTGDQLARPGFPAGPEACWPPFESGEITLLGKPFLQQFYSIWDFGAKELSKFSPTLSLGVANLGN